MSTKPHDTAGEPLPEAAWARSMVRLVDWDQRCLLALHAGVRREWVITLMRVVSRLGDGLVWYGTAFVLLVSSDPIAHMCVRHMGITGAVGLVCYYALKRRTGRPRPYATMVAVRCCGRPLDEFSFPSGHALHAFGIGLTVALAYPGAILALAPLVLLIALSRVVLGLHYPSDVLAGAALGSTIAALVFLLA